jgi:glycosyltransferase involved in cell wall biosynthesis
MRILVDIRHLINEKQSGVGEYTTQLLRALFEIDKKNEYVLLSSGTISLHSPFGLGRDDNVKYIHLDQPNKLLNLRTALLKHPTFNWHVRDPIDLIFLPNLNIVSLPTDIPTVLTIHDLSWRFFPEFYSRKMQLWHKAVEPSKLIAQSRRIIVPSASTAQDVMEVFGVDEKKIATIPHGVDPLFSPKMEARDHGVRSRLKLPKKFALFVGTIEPRKNLLGLIEGVKHYRERTRDDVHLVLAGKWGWRAHQVRHRLWKSDVKNWIHYLGYVAAEDRPALYRSAIVFTWPSIYEGFGLPVLEAMASGTPVITTRTSSLPELTDQTALLIDPFNIMDISEALRQVLNSRPIQQKLKERGLARASKFSWEKTAQETLSLFVSF